MIDTGTLVDGRYKVLSRLGAGGMADVFLAEDQQLGRKVALKLLHRRFAEDPGFVERFRREAQAAAGLQHPNVVSVYDRGAFDGTYYIAMEYLPGRTLKQLIRDEAPLDPIRAIDITIQILKAARFAHQRGVIHRDLKPHNVIVDESDHAKVTDFGIARAGASDMTETGSIMGTAQYLSPEQAQGHAVSASSDLYSIAVVLYELLTGRVPFDAEPAVTIALKHVSEAPTPPTALNPSVPPELEQVVMWALNKNPADRPKDADDFIAALETAKAAIQSGGAGSGRPASRRSAAAAAADGGARRCGRPASRRAAAGGPLPAHEAGIENTDPGPSGADRRRRPIWPWLVGAAAAPAARRRRRGGVPAHAARAGGRPEVVLDQSTTARTVLRNLGFTVSVINQTSGQPPGIVIAQDPLAAPKVDKGSTVTLTVPSGPGNGDRAVGRRADRGAGREADPPGQAEGRAGHPPVLEHGRRGHVISTDPPAGANPPVGTKVNDHRLDRQAARGDPDVTATSQASAKAAPADGGVHNVTTASRLRTRSSRAT